MPKTLTLLLCLMLLTAACAQGEAALPPTSTAPAEPAATTAPAASQTPLPAAPSTAAPAEAWNTYANRLFGLGFQFPAGWYGPDEYISDQTLRVAVGSDVVYPYGTDRTEQVYTIHNSYQVVVQYSQNDQNAYWRETVQSLANLTDGQALSDRRSLVIRVRGLDFGRFEGVEFITTLPDSAQTEPVYIRQVILFDDQSNVVTITGSPSNVDTGGTGWREAYRQVDAANQAIFYQILESLTID